jgi:hypothetical protein
MMLLGIFLSAPAAATPEDIHTHPVLVTDEELFGSLDLDRPGLEAVKDAAAAGDYAAAAEAWASYWRQRQKPTLHFDRDEWPAFMRERYPQVGDAMVEMARKVAGGDISHATIGFPVEGREINWLQNPTKDSNYVSLAGSQWFLAPLGRAYLLTGDEAFAEAFAWIFESWFDHKPRIAEFKGGINIDPLYHAYYPGIRLRILLDNYYCMAASPALTPAIHVKLMKELLAGSSWLYADNARYKIGNQQVGAVLGMTVVGMVVPEFRQSSAWVERGVQRMREHLEKDFHPDGAHRELCTQYHKTCLRDMAHVALTAARNGLPSFFDADDPSAEAFERAYEWLARIAMPEGLTPPLHSAVFSNDYAIHLQVAGEQFGRADFLQLASRVWEKGLVPSQKGPVSLSVPILSPPTDVRISAALASPLPLSENLPDSGFAIMRTGWEEGDRYLVFQYGWPNTGHAYPGALHFLLAMNGEVIATSPGSPRSYALPSYRYCHSTPSHNVVSIDNQSYIGKNRLAPGGTLHRYADLDRAWYIRASHEGYMDSFGAVHDRQLLVVKDGPIVIRDRITGGAGHKAQWNFHTPLLADPSGPGQITLTGKRAYALSLADSDTLSEPRIEMHWAAVPPAMCQPDDCGREVPAITFEREIGETGTEFLAAITEGDGSIERLRENACRVTFGDTSALVIFAADGEPVVVEGIETDAECAFVQYDGGKPAAACVIAGKRLAIDGEAWLDAPEPMSAEVRGK